ncbi:MAG: PKD domain-containing protein [Candidatus Bathyarchaeia archaeon]
MQLKKVLSTCLLFSILIIIKLPICHSSQSSDPLYLAVSTNKPAYYIRENILIQGALKQDGTPISNALVAVEIRNPSNLPIIFRTVPTGNISATTWPVNFVSLYPTDSIDGNPKYSFIVKQILYIRGTIKNFDSQPHSALVALTLYDGNNIPLGVWYPMNPTLNPGESRTFSFMATRLDPWAYPGNATIFANIYSNLPKDGGIPYCPEKSVSFEIKRNPELSYSTTPPSTPPTNEGTFLTNLRLHPESKSGIYTIYTSTSKDSTLIQNATTFQVESSPSPPQASFFYTPLEPYVNMSIAFDASSSTAEGYNDTIVKYEWDFGDGTPKESKTTPTINHTFTQVNTYIVTLNVTDSEGLWSITSKPITILPPTGPTANFIWYPSTPLVNQTVTFDATSSKLGWNGTASPPIVNYEWNFGDGNITSGNYPTITHKYSAEANYTVTLTITDAGGLKDNETKIVIVRFIALLGDINGDGTVDIFDAILLSISFGAKPGNPNWNPNADLDNSGEIDIFDAIILSAHYGESI